LGKFGKEVGPPLGFGNKGELRIPLRVKSRAQGMEGSHEEVPWREDLKSLSF